MEVFQKILTKEEINTRFVMAVNAVLKNKLVSNKSSLAESLNVKPAKFSEILNGRMKAGTDMIAIMCDFYNVSPDWLLMSRGEFLFRQNPLPNIWVDDNPLNYEPFTQKKESVTITDSNGIIDTLMKMINEKDRLIRKQAEEIGMLKQQVSITEIKKTDVGHAQTSDIANAG